MIYLDVTKTGGAGHRSGLTRVTTRLQHELGSHARVISWPQWPRALEPNDWILTAELFSEAERPGIGAFLRDRPCRMAALFHDAIPLKFPHITWPHSVARHPSYMKLLAQFDAVWAISEASKRELEGFWRWQQADVRAQVHTLPLGADFSAQPRVRARGALTAPPRLLCVGILEPRKNQTFLLDVAETLAREKMAFELHLVGRVNPVFGKPVRDRARQAARRFPGIIHWHEAAGDTLLGELYRTAAATVFPTIAEGCGLPLLESLWAGTPCVCSDLPVLRENADGGGCVAAPVYDHAAWAAALRRILTDGAYQRKLTEEACARALPTWADTASTLTQALA